MNNTRGWTHGLFLFSLINLALWLPLPLYLVSLALFGLPHVVWEMGFLRSRYGARWPWRWWLPLWGILLLQAAARIGVWLGAYPASSSQIVDLASLMLLALWLALAPLKVPWPLRLAGLVLAAVMLWLLQNDAIVTALLILALAHNLTPMLMVWDLAREDATQKRLAYFISALFVLPVLMVASAWSGAITPAFLSSQQALLSSQLPASWGQSSLQQALLSAMVLAQCLHYYCVIYCLPQAETQRRGQPVLPRRVMWITVGIVAAMLLYYAHDYSAARKLYAVAAGAHAWLEWPVLLLALLGFKPAPQRA